MSANNILNKKFCFITAKTFDSQSEIIIHIFRFWQKAVEDVVRTVPS